MLTLCMYADSTLMFPLTSTLIVSTDDNQN